MKRNELESFVESVEKDERRYWEMLKDVHVGARSWGELLGFGKIIGWEIHHLLINLYASSQLPLNKVLLSRSWGNGETALGYGILSGGRINLSGKNHLSRSWNKLSTQLWFMRTRKIRGYGLKTHHGLWWPTWSLILCFVEDHNIIMCFVYIVWFLLYGNILCILCDF